MMKGKKYSGNKNCMRLVQNSRGRANKKEVGWLSVLGERQRYSISASK